MFNAHKNMNLSDKEFDAIVESLVNTLKELKIRKDVIADIIDVIEPLR
jgi:truncated hemoglobin YjbI